MLFTYWVLFISLLTIPLILFFALEFSKKVNTKRAVIIGGILLIFTLPVAVGGHINQPKYF